MDDLSNLSIEEQIAFHVAALKRLRASMLRSDWHAALEAALRLATDKYGDAIRLLVEEELGIEPPRADFIVVRQDRNVSLDEPIFDHFRGHNIIEYKNPNDVLNESVLWKTIGYAGLYISERNVNEGDVTLTIIRASKNKEFFERLERVGKLRKGDIKGVYSVAERLPTRIILTDDLMGEQYAPYRALSNKPKEDDIEYLIDAADKDEEKRKYLRVILNLVAAKHPEMIEEIKGRDKSMTSKWMEIFKDEIAVERAEARIQAYAEMVDKGLVTIDQASNALGMTVDEFKAAVEKIKVVTA